MHQTLYRKYRPKNFEEVYGQNVIVKILQNQIENDSISHAYIFSGPRGTGKTSVAKIFAKVVNCLNESNQPCDECVNCTQTNTGDSLDIVEIDAASNNGIDEIRELKSKVSLVPTNGKYKVYIIDEVHMLTTAAFNALLKTLEEPPKHIIFILATTEQHKIPETIISRCQKFEFKRISDSELVSRLELIANNEKIDITKEALKEIARLSDGGMRDSIGNLELVSSYQLNQIQIEDVHEINGTISPLEIKEFFDHILNGNTREVLETIDNYYNRGKNLTKIIEELILFLKNCLVVANIPDYFIDSSIYNDVNKRLDYKKIIDIVNNISKNLQEIKKYSNSKIMIEILFINLINTYFYKKEEVLKPVSEMKNLKEPEVELLKKEEEPEIKETKKEVEKEIPKFEPKTSNLEYEEIKRIRVDNTLAEVSKTKLQELKNALAKIEISSLDHDTAKYFHYISDGEIKAASENTYIIVFETQTLRDYYNKALVQIEQALKSEIDLAYRSIAIDAQEWEYYRNEFKNKERKYEVKSDSEALKQYLNSLPKEKNTIEAAFADLIQVR